MKKKKKKKNSTKETVTRRNVFVQTCCYEMPKHKSDKTPAPPFPAALHRPSIWRSVPPPRSPWPPPPVGTTPHCPSTSSARPWEATPPCRPPSACCITSERTATRSPTSFTPTQPCKGLGAWQVEVKAISLLLFERACLSRPVKRSQLVVSLVFFCFVLFVFVASVSLVCCKLRFCFVAIPFHQRSRQIRGFS